MAMTARRGETPDRLNIAIVGAGIAGMSAAWLLSRRHQVTLYEQDSRIGGHSHTVDAPGPAGPVPVDTGFIVYNDRNYPNLVALFDHLNVPTRESNMSFAVSLDDGALEYAGGDPHQLFAQPANIFRPRFWSMLRDLMRFYREAPEFLARDDPSMTIGEYFRRGGYGDAFRDDHLFPMAAAIWSTEIADIGDYPAAALIRFCDNHGLLSLRGRPQWRTVAGGSREYVSRLTAPYADRILTGRAVRAITRTPRGVSILDSDGQAAQFDHVVVATHGDQALRLLADPSPDESALLGAFRSTRNLAVLHRDASLMPRRRAAWASWNYLGRRGGVAGGSPLCLTYWMNLLQGIPNDNPLFVTLNPARPPRPDSVISTETYEHPLFDVAAIRAQRELWRLQGQRNTWFCGAWFGSGFHEDGLQAGLAVAEALGGVRRPWTVPDESGRIHLGPLAPVRLAS
jgi:predicted NAD/FAD-binding protein